VVKRRHHHADFDLPRTELSRLVTSNGSMNHFSLQDELIMTEAIADSAFFQYGIRFFAADDWLLWSGHGRHLRRRMKKSFLIGATGRPYLLPAISSVNTISRCLSCRSIFRFPTYSDREDMAPSHLSPVRMFMMAAGHDASYEVLPEQLHCLSTWKSSMPATRAIFVVGVA
jgi:hypothetical protein